MFLGIKITSEQSSKLEGILQGILSYLKTSKDSIYGDYTVNESSQIINKTLNRVKSEKRVRLMKLRILFSPAGALQDISLENNWADEYLDLSKKFDALLIKA